MNCMKCGRETEQVFCQECLAEMEKYPVRPGTVVQLPRHPESPQVKKAHPRRRVHTADEQIKKLKKRSRALFVIWLITLALLAAVSYFAVTQLMEQNQLLPGQNYSSITSTPEATETE